MCANHACMQLLLDRQADPTYEGKVRRNHSQYSHLLNRGRRSTSLALYAGWLPRLKRTNGWNVIYWINYDNTRNKAHSTRRQKQPWPCKVPADETPTRHPPAWIRLDRA